MTSRRTPHYPIRVVCRRTGLKAATVRAWERRYEAVAPRRAPSRHRLYSEADIERLTLLRRALEAGWRIGQVAALTDAELEERLSAAPPQEDSASGQPAEDAETFLSSCLAAVERLDADALVGALYRASLVLGRRRLIDRLLSPLMQTIGRRWAEGTLRPVHEHLATAVVRSFVQVPGRSRASGSPAPRLLIATPRGQVHEVGALLAAAAAEEQGWSVVYLGADLPAEEIAAAASQARVQAVALGIVYPADDPAVAEDVIRLRRLLASEVAIIAGGAAALAYAGALREAGAVCVGGLDEFRHRLERLRLAES